VRVTGTDLISVVEGRSSVLSPGHLPDAGVPLHPLDSQPRMELAFLQAGHEQLEGSEEFLTAVGR
jgi:hypothetical protein